MSFQDNLLTINSKCLHAVFENAAKRFQNKIAVTDGKSELSYTELSEKSSVLAAHLCNMGVKNGDLVCIYVSRNVSMIISILGVLKAGAAYIPIDPEYPPQRVNDIFDISGAKYCVCDCYKNKNLDNIRCNTILLDRLIESNDCEKEFLNLSEETDLAYVIFTSGSTGKPKGVMIEHISVFHLFAQADAIYHFDENDVWSLFHSVAFDYSVWEIWGALLFGGKLVIIPRKIAVDPDSFFQLVYRERITILSQTPTAFRNFCLSALRQSQKTIEHLRFIVFGGEKLDFEILKPWFQKYGDSHPTLINMYGITEVTVHSTWKIISQEDICDDALSLIGTPLPHLLIEIIDSEGQKAPQGEAGRMFISGSSVARGYLNREDLTTERFVTKTEPDGSVRKWFDTGDIAVEIEENEFAYIGRNDRQIKISGYRIELEEIEYCLKQLKGVSDCVIIDKDYGDNDIRLSAYIILDNAEGRLLTLDALREYAVEKLPNYMCPSFYSFVDTFPMNINGKFSIREIESTQEPRIKDTHHIQSTKQVVYNIWRDILGDIEFTMKDNFFYLGGTSIMMINMLQRLRETFDIEINLEDLYAELTINNITIIIENICCNSSIR